MAGTEGEDESTENAMRPPQSVVISSTEADEIPKSVDAPLLTGSVVAADVHAQTVSQPIAQSQLQYVMGPDGQMYAYQKPPFNWKHFCLGFFIPVGIIFAQLLLSVMLTEDYDDWDYYDYVQNIDLEFTKYEGSALSLSLPPSNDYVITYCSIIQVTILNRIIVISGIMMTYRLQRQELPIRLVLCIKQIIPCIWKKISHQEIIPFTMNMSNNQDIKNGLNCKSLTIRISEPT